MVSVSQPMSKDTKTDVKHSVLSPKVRSSAIAPKPRLGRKVRIVEDYVSIDGDALSPPSSPLASVSASGGVCASASIRSGNADSKGAVGSGSRGTAGKTGPDSPSSSEKSDGDGAGADGERVEPVITVAEELYLRSLSRRSDITDYKHYYQFVNPSNPPFTASGGERYLPLLPVVAGVNLNNRLTNKIRAHRSIIRLWLAIVPNAIGTQAPIWPTVTLMVFREKLPAIIGVPINMYVTGANPPINTNTIMDRLGVVQSVAADAVAIRAPINVDKYVMKLMKHIDTRDTLGEITSAPATAIQPNWNVPFGAKKYEFDIPWDGTELQYNEATQGAASVNALWANLRIDYAGAANDTANGFQVQYNMSTDTEFTDVQDDAI